jgi:transcriptional regulator with XRE-family HTH domain
MNRARSRPSNEQAGEVVTGPVVDDGHDLIGPAIGSAIRGARGRAGLSMTDLAKRCGLSQPYLSQLENGKASPSIHTLYRIANALDLTPQDLLPPSGGAPFVVSRAGSDGATPIEHRDDAALARVLVGSPDRLIQAQEVTATGDQSLGGWFEHDGEDLVYLVEGVVDVTLSTGHSVRLHAGDSVWYSSQIPHQWSRVDGADARILVISAAVPGRDPGH